MKGGGNQENIAFITLGMVEACAVFIRPPNTILYSWIKQTGVFFIVKPVRELRRLRAEMEHRHDRYRRHPVSRRHRSLRLDVKYPKENLFFRAKVIKDMSSYEFMIRYISDERFKGAFEKAQKMLGSVKREGGPIEIYVGQLLVSAVRMIRTSGKPLTDEELVEQFMDGHFIVHVHEVLHRMWQWESTFEENRRRSRKRASKREEMTVRDLSLWIRNIMYVKPQYTESVWKQFCEKYRMLNQQWRIKESAAIY